MLRFLLLALSVLLLHACANITPPASTAPAQKLTWDSRLESISSINTFQILGKISLKTPQEQFAASLNWQQMYDRYLLSLYGPLGIQGMTLTGTPTTVTLQTSDGKKHQAQSTDQLLSKWWGYPVPLEKLKYWVKGIPAPGPHLKKLDAYNRLSYLQQNGFRIWYLGYGAFGKYDLPQSITISAPHLQGRLVIHRWHF